MKYLLTFILGFIFGILFLWTAAEPLEPIDGCSADYCRFNQHLCNAGTTNCSN